MRMPQVSTKLKVGVMFDHNGTYMEGFGFAYRELQVTVEIADNDELAVTLNGKALQLPQSQADLEVIPYVRARRVPAALAAPPRRALATPSSSPQVPLLAPQMCQS